MKSKIAVSGALLGLLTASSAFAVTSAEVYTSDAYQYGRFSARIQFAPGSGVVSSFFMWKDGSEKPDVFWNELDFEKLEQECRLETNTIYGDPEGLDPEQHVLDFNLCNEYHVYAYEWTPDYIAWSIDGVEIRRDTGEPAAAFRDNTAEGMQLRFNVWPGDASFGGAFDPSILPVYEYIDWVEYASYSNGTFQTQWREDFTDGKLPSGWLTGSWESPKGNSTHSDDNVGIIDGYIVLALTADDATGFAAANPRATDTAPPAATSAPETSAPAPSTTEPATSDTTAPPVTTTDPGTTAPDAADSTTEQGCACTVGKSNTRGASTALLAIAAALAAITSRITHRAKRNVARH